MAGRLEDAGGALTAPVVGTAVRMASHDDIVSPTVAGAGGRRPGNAQIQSRKTCTSSVKTGCSLPESPVRKRIPPVYCWP